MIIKVQHEGQWWVYDNLQRVRYNKVKIDYHEYQKLIYEGTADIILLQPKDIGAPVEMYEVCYRNTRDEEKLMVFDEVAYLCNDNGQTIEKLVI